MEKPGMMSIITFVTLPLILFFAATPTSLQAKDRDARFKVTNGTIVSFDTTAKLIVVDNHQGQDSIVLTGKTIYSLFSTPIHRSNFKAGDRVTVHYIEKGGNLSARRVVLIAAGSGRNSPVH